MTNVGLMYRALLSLILFAIEVQGVHEKWETIQPNNGLHKNESWTCMWLKTENIKVS